VAEFSLVSAYIFMRLAFPFFALKGRQISAGGEATGIWVPVTSRPDRGAGPGLKKEIFVITMARPAPLPGRKAIMTGLPVASPPANSPLRLRRRSEKIWMMTSLYASARIRGLSQTKIYEK
jgi:hypothetical protein